MKHEDVCECPTVSADSMQKKDFADQNATPDLPRDRFCARQKTDLMIGLTEKEGEMNIKHRAKCFTRSRDSWRSALDCFGF